MQTRTIYIPRKSLRIKPHDDFFNRSPSREISFINLSSEYYHGGASVTVPFDWESEPGTPKAKFHEIQSLPPITPPPSYFYSTTKRSVKNHSKPKLLDAILSKRPKMRKTHKQQQFFPASASSSSPSISSSSSSASSSRSSSPWPRSYSVPSSPITTSNLYNARNDQLSRARLFTDSGANEEEQEYKSSVPTPCFGRRSASIRSRGFRSTILKLLLRDH